ncbi:MAG TPA: hypothetical protein VI819_03590 [Patescibacteria group bacterium]|nr:hypothetical protein [Patescibacteria group bacterium]
MKAIVKNLLFLALTIFFFIASDELTIAQEYGTYSCTYIPTSPSCSGNPASCTTYGCRFPTDDSTAGCGQFNGDAVQCSSSTFACDFCPIMTHSPMQISDCSQGVRFQALLLNDTMSYTIRLYNLGNGRLYDVPQASIVSQSSYDQTLYFDVTDINDENLVLCNNSQTSARIPSGFYQVRLYTQGTSYYRVSNAGSLYFVQPVITPQPGTCSCNQNGTACTVNSSPTCNSGYLPSCFYGGTFCGCNCVTPTPGGSGLPCPVTTPGIQCCASSSACSSPAGTVLTQYSCATGVCCQGACTAVAPTVAIPPEFAACDTTCSANPEPYTIGNCSRTGGNPDTSKCQRPVSNPGYDCNINGVTYDCFCCSELLSSSTAALTPRPSLPATCANNGIDTAIGCLPVGNRQLFLQFILRWALGISGGTALVMIAYSGILIMTAQGDKQRLQTGKEFLTASVAGIMMIIFSAYLLQLIGVTIFRLPGI